MSCNCKRLKSHNYASLGVYNQGGQIKAPTPCTTGLYVVPVFGTYGYTSLTSERVGLPPSPTGYFTLGTGYGNCNLGSPYVRSACM